MGWCLGGCRPSVWRVLCSGYSGEVPTWEMGYGRERDTGVPSVADLFRGKTSSAVHLHVKTFDGSKVPTG